MMMLIWLATMMREKLIQSVAGVTVIGNPPSGAAGVLGGRVRRATVATMNVAFIVSL